MKNRIVLFLLCISVYIIFIGTAFAENSYPQPKGYVNDFAGVIDDADRAYMNALMTEVEQNTSAEIAVVTIDGLNTSSLEEYSVGLFSKWEIGKKGKDNGILVLYVVEQRRIRIEVGYGLEGIIPDGRAGRILDNNLYELKNGSASIGLRGVVDEVSDIILSEYAEGSGRDMQVVNYAGIVGVLIINIIIFGIVIVSMYFATCKLKCDKCKIAMDQKFVGNDIVYTCPKCKKKIRKKRTYPMIMAGGYGGHGDGMGGGGFGGGMGGGGGASR